MQSNLFFVIKDLSIGLSESSEIEKFRRKDALAVIFGTSHFRRCSSSLYETEHVQCSLKAYSQNRKRATGQLI